MKSQSQVLVLIKLAHTAVWLFFAACTVGILFFDFIGNYRNSLILSAIVGVEVVILAVNGMSCPLTSWAAKYTLDRKDNFDIYLPNWLARYNKIIFGPLFFIGLLIAVAGGVGWI